MESPNKTIGTFNGVKMEYNYIGGWSTINEPIQNIPINESLLKRIGKRFLSIVW
jgi:hypothetical protein